MNYKINRLVSHPYTSEKVLERRLVEELKTIHLRCIKYSNSNEIGYPDRLVLLPNSKVIWVEIKSTSRKPSRVQNIRHWQLRQLHHEVYVVDSIDDILKLVSFIKQRLPRVNEV